MFALRPNTLPTILHVDDALGDATLLQVAIQHSIHNARFRYLTSAKQCRAYLEGEGVYQDRHLYPLPHLMVLDLDLPDESGLEVLSWIRNHPEFAMLPIIALKQRPSGSEELAAMDLGVNAFFSKMPACGPFVGAVRKLLSTPMPAPVVHNGNNGHNGHNRHNGHSNGQVHFEPGTLRREPELVH